MFECTETGGEQVMMEQGGFFRYFPFVAMMLIWAHICKLKRAAYFLSSPDRGYTADGEKTSWRIHRQTDEMKTEPTKIKAKAKATIK